MCLSVSDINYCFVGEDVMGIMDSLYDNDKKLFVYTRDNVEIYYEEGFNIQFLDENSMISVVHNYHEFFKVVMPHDNFICEFVLTGTIEFNPSKRNKISLEMGVDDRSSGFVNHLIGSDDIYPMFFTTYSENEIDEATRLVPSY